MNLIQAANTVFDTVEGVFGLGFVAGIASALVLFVISVSVGASLATTLGIVAMMIPGVAAGIALALRMKPTAVEDVENTA